MIADSEEEMERNNNNNEEAKKSNGMNLWVERAIQGKDEVGTEKSNQSIIIDSKKQSTSLILLMTQACNPMQDMK